MKNTEIKFSNYPFIVPTRKRMCNKFESLIQELKQCGSARTAALAVKHWNKYSEEIGTEFAVISVLYSLDTRYKAYQRAQATLDELSPLSESESDLSSLSSYELFELLFLFFSSNFIF